MLTDRDEDEVEDDDEIEAEVEVEFDLPVPCLICRSVEGTQRVLRTRQL
jgi:hypothetical protein